jgi:hypothetical protein
MMEFLVLAHLAVSGAAYPYDCCSAHDCFEISHQDVVSLGGDRWRIIDTGEVMKSRKSIDERYHRCTVSGAIKARTRCLLIPEFGV